MAADAALTALRSDFDATLDRCRRYGQTTADHDVYTTVENVPNAKELFQENILLRPVLLACDAKVHSKVTGFGVALLQRIVTMKVVPEVRRSWDCLQAEGRPVG